MSVLSIVSKFYAFESVQQFRRLSEGLSSRRQDSIPGQSMWWTKWP